MNYFISAIEDSDEIVKIRFCKMFAPKIFKDSEDNLVNWEKFWGFLLKNQDILKRCRELYIKLVLAHLRENDTCGFVRVVCEIKNYREQITKEYKVREKREKRKNKK